MSKAEDVRQYVAKHPNATNKEVSEQTGASPQQVSNLRSKMGTKVSGTATATKPAANKTGPKPGAKRAATKSSTSATAGSIQSLIEVRKLAKSLGGTAEVRTLLDAVDQLDA